MCIFTGNSDLIFSERTWILMDENILLCASCVKRFSTCIHVHGFIWQRSCFDMFLTVNVRMLHKYDNYQIIMCITNIDYDFLSDCPLLMHSVGIHYVQRFHQCLILGYAHVGLPTHFFHFIVANTRNIAKLWFLIFSVVTHQYALHLETEKYWVEYHVYSD